MSWQAYVDDSLVKSGHIDKAAIISVAGDSVWATSAGFTVRHPPFYPEYTSPVFAFIPNNIDHIPLKPDEMKNIANVVTGAAGAVDKALAEGIHVGGERYVVFRAEDRSMYGRQGRTGILAVKTTQAILVGHYGEGVQAGNAAQTVEALADYLIKVGY
ncbi:hypothetical protein PG997_008461 [Apiospora hydei]|uniref:Profilin n=1 Tax=Apiospora hydei TaxID=1337664 RepID=A0ABR1WEX6_9PEZI